MKIFKNVSRAALSAALFCCLAVAQSDRGTLTGTITDPASAVVPGAKVTIRNLENGAVLETVSTPTGNYTLSSVSPGTYELIVEAAGFKKTTQTGIQIQVATTLRVDTALQVGATSDSVTITAEATLLKTESGEISNNVSGDRINALPINFGGGGGAGGNVRGWLNFANLSPGVTGTGQSNRVNGAQAAQYKIIIEGQDISSSNDINYTSTAVQSSVEQIEEFTLQTSNYAPEFGQVAGGLFNFSIKSGTNAFHGSLYEYFANEALDASRPFVGIRPFSRKHDFGGLLTGPVWIPKIYNGRNRTFFSFNNESFRNRIQPNANFVTLPTDAYRNGDFSAALTLRPGFVRGKDNQGNPVIDGVIYDPATNATVNGLVYRTPFPGNIIPKSRFDPVSVAIQNMIPKTNVNGNALFNNWIPSYTNDYTQNLPGVKIDQTINNDMKMSFYVSQLITNKLVSPDGLPPALSAMRVSRTSGTTLRANYDYVISPTVVLHLGAGYLRFFNPDTSPDDSLLYDAVGGIGFKGSTTNPSGFPRITGITDGNYGGMINMGPTNANRYYDNKWTSVASIAYVRDKHTYKAGGEYQLNSWTDRNTRQAQGVLNFSATETGPATATNGITLASGQSGLGYASFLLGAVNNASVSAPQDPQIRGYKYAAYVQDDWKVSRKLTINYGLRWDVLTEGHEIHYRSSIFGPTVPNPNAGGRLGGLVYEGYGDGRCNCKFSNPYPFAIGPRLSAAYQMNTKTVIRAGAGVIYGNLPTIGYSTNNQIQGVGIGSAVFPSNASNGLPALYLRNGLVYNSADLYKVTLDPGLLVTPGGSLNGGPAATTDPNSARPPRILQYNVSVQREIGRDLAVEVAYVGNRSVWLTQTSLVSPNMLTKERLASFGLDPFNNAADRTLLTGPLTSALAVARGFNKLPYPGFLASNTVAQSLRPFPQFSGSLAPRWSPLGKSWYDSLQAKVTKRYSHGLDGSLAFTWDKELSTYGQSDLTNRALNKGLTSTGIPLILVIGLNYETPKFTGNKLVREVVGGWTFGTLLQYQSGVLIAAPSSKTLINSYLFGGATRKTRIPGVPLYLKDPNCGCIDPTKDLILNPAAWAEVPEGTYTPSSQYFDDYRQARRPTESMSLGRRFSLGKVREGMSLSIRAEFFNVFNRTQLAYPSSGDSEAGTTRNAATGNLTGGFGFVDAFGAPGTPNALPRNGQLVARFQF